MKLEIKISLLSNFDENKIKNYFLSQSITFYDLSIHNNIKIINQIDENLFLGEFDNKSILIKSLHNTFHSFNEIMVMKAVESNFTVQIVGILKNDQNHKFIMTESAPFGCLKDCIHNLTGKLSLQFKIALDIARSLQNLYLSSGLKLIHREVTSNSIFIFSLDDNLVNQIDSIHAKLGNFENIVFANASYTERISNYRYTAPEALKGSIFVPYTSEIDIYAFGILFWEILTGKIPFSDLNDDPDIESKIIEGYRPDIKELEQMNIPNSVIELISSCWDTNPSKRPNFNEIIPRLVFHIEVLHNNQIHQKDKNLFIDSLSKSLRLKELIVTRNISVNNFYNFKCLSKGSNGLALSAKLNIDQEVFDVVIKMLYSNHFRCTSVNELKKEFDILPDILYLHPNIIRTVGEFQGYPSNEMIEAIIKVISDEKSIIRENLNKSSQFYILEYHPITLNALLKEKKRLSVNEQIRYAVQLSSALNFLFSQRIVHLDLKPDNILVSSFDELIIIDFGESGHMNDNGFVGCKNGGAPVTLAPEVLSAKFFEKDLPCMKQHSWELGINLYFMCSGGYYPFTYSNFNDFKNIGFSFDTNSIDPIFHEILSLLLCNEKDRIDIVTAHNILTEISAELNKNI